MTGIEAAAPHVQVDVEWGVSGARSLTEGPDAADVVVVVDVLSFSTSVTIACERGARVWPHPGGEAAHQLARSLEAVLAGTRSHTAGPSLSPASLLDLPEGVRLVLPSPNGSSISHVLMGSRATVLIGCLRNADAVAKRVASEVEARTDRGTPDAPLRVALIPAGERWGDGSLRVAYEDHVGAGAVVARLAQVLGAVRLSPEALVAARAFEQLADLRATPSGRELVERGFADDVALAEQVDASSVVPVLRDGSFTA
ncbi:2-phosphosulfolactate phosphatase [Angustibacter sp. Root456]|uniref:2-phosphosulfolactate phosphatase n=1 Tax=Angustibacter sp. Root456 TaxID=1736539 RepID=UPI0009E6F9EF|nr:2-phosphosulfolactate phosphatase [Angustibacter sp. Root456]